MSGSIKISDSGGYEGSAQLLRLSTRNGGILNFFYEHYGIPDRFIIRYDGLTLLDTKFVGGSRTSAIEIPAGNADDISVVVATNDTGTAWNYWVEFLGTECQPPVPWTVSALTGEIQHNDQTDRCEATGNISLGRLSGGNPGIARINGTGTSYDHRSLRVTDGLLFAAAISTTQPLFQGSFDMAWHGGGMTQVRGGSTDLANDWKIAGLEVDFHSFVIRDTEIESEVSIHLPNLLGGGVIDTRASSAIALFMNASGVGFTTSDNPSSWINVPLPPDLPYKGLLITAKQVQLGYDRGADGLFLKGRYEIKPAAIPGIAPKLLKAEGDAGIFIKGGSVDIKGTFEAGDIPLGWISLGKVKFELDTTQANVKAEASINLPFLRGTVARDLGFNVNAELSIATGFDVVALGISATGLAFRLPTIMPIWLTEIGFAARNLHKPADLELGGTLGLGLFGKVGANYLTTIVGTLTAGRSSMSGSLTAKVNRGSNISSPVLEASGKGSWKYAGPDEFRLSGTFTAVDGLFSGSGSLTLAAGGITGQATGTVAIPKSFAVVGGMPILSGTLRVTYSNDNLSANDFIEGYGYYNIPLYGQGYAGFRYYWGSNLLEELKGGDLVAATIPSPALAPQALALTAETLESSLSPPLAAAAAVVGTAFMAPVNTAAIILAANWTNPITSAPGVSVVRPDGTTISQADFAANNIAIIPDLTDTTRIAVVVNQPTVGAWALALDDPTPLGTITYFGRTPTTNTPLALKTLTQTKNDQISVTFASANVANTSQIAFFADRDNSGTDGIALDGPRTLRSISGRNTAGDYVVTVDTSGLETGAWNLYALLTATGNATAVSYATETFNIQRDTDLELTVTANRQEVGSEEAIIYTLSVLNKSAVAAQGVVLTTSLSSDMAISSSSRSYTRNGTFASGYTLAYDLGNMAASARTTFTLTTTAPASDFTDVTLGAIVASTTLDPDTSNNTAQLTLDNAGIAGHGADLNLTMTTPTPATRVGETFRQQLVITNQGTAPVPRVLVVLNTNATLSKTSTGSLNTNASQPTLTLPGLDAGASTTVTVEGFVTTLGTFYFEAVAKPIRTNGTAIADIDLSDNAAITSLPVGATIITPIDLELTAKTSTIGTNGAFSVTFTVINKGSNIAAGVSVAVTLPEGIGYGSHSTSQGTFDWASGLWAPGNLGENIARTLTLNLNGSGPNRTLAAEVMTVDLPDHDSVPGNGNTAEDDYAGVTVSLPVQGSAPTAITLSRTEVREDWFSRSVATLGTKDADAGDTFDYRLLSDPSGLFIITGDTLGLKQGVNFDFETARQHTLKIQSVDRFGLSVTSDLTLLVTNVAGETWTGSQFDDFRYGEEEEDSLNGAGGNDTLYGAGGDDTLIGGPGNDTLGGGEGTDRAIFTGPRLRYSVVHDYQSNDLIVTDTLVGGDDTDTVAADIEHLVFADGTVGTATFRTILSIAAVSADRAESDAGTNRFTFLVTRAGGLDGSSSAAWVTTGSGASPADAADFVGGALPTGTISFAPGETTQMIEIEVTGDTSAEPDEGFTVSLGTAIGSVLGSASATGVIRNDDVQPVIISIERAGPDSLEGTGADGAIAFNIIRTGAISSTSTVAWTVTGVGRSPASAADFIGGALPSGNVTFDRGETIKTIAIGLAGDSTPEFDERFAVTLSNPFGATIGDATTTGAILNDDAGPDDSTITSGPDDETFRLGPGVDTVMFSGAHDEYRIGVLGQVVRVSGPDGNDELHEVERLSFADIALITTESLYENPSTEPLMSFLLGTRLTFELPLRYSGPLALDYVYPGSDIDDVVAGTPRNDFINLGGGNDAMAMGEGDDIADGGGGSNFLSGGPGRDTFFLDGRFLLPVWSCITDWEDGEEMALWGWREGISQSVWAENDGLPGWEGATLFCDIDGNGLVETAVTWTGRQVAELPQPDIVDVGGTGLLWFR